VVNLFLKDTTPQHDPCPYCGSQDIDMTIGGIIIGNRAANIWHCNACGQNFEEIDDEL